ncbi:MAG: hypothetical protein O7C75_15055 [Verrucomicrobia bacterium]|nr:hypothetical protein [Verrucomicrobiota bacterium]
MVYYTLMVQKQDLLKIMLSILMEALEDQGSPTDGVTDQSPLIGPDALTTSLAFVSIIADIEMTLADEGLEVTLVSEEALSRSHSPFRTLDALSDYVLELIQATDSNITEMNSQSSNP